MAEFQLVEYFAAAVRDIYKREILVRVQRLTRHVVRNAKHFICAVLKRELLIATSATYSHVLGLRILQNAG